MPSDHLYRTALVALGLLITPLTAGCDQTEESTTDSGRASDAGDRVDTGMPTDSSTALDSGVPTDSGSPRDGGVVADTGPVTPPVRPTVELIADRHFARGFNAQDPNSGDIIGTMNPGFATGAPLWQLGQWGSATSISDGTRTTLPSGAVQWEDTYGAVIIGPSGTDEADLTFRVNAVEEYGGVYRTSSATRTWPHLLGEQRLSAPGNAGPGCPPLSEIDSLVFSADARLHYDNKNRRAGYDASRHAAAYLIYFTVQNLRDPAAAGYGDYLWFGLTLYDDRDAMPGLAVAGDDATGKLIYNIGLTELTTASLDDTSWHALRADLLPHIVLALEEAWRRGYLPDSRELSDYRIGGMNLGWEIPGLNSTQLQLRDLSLAYSTPGSVTTGEVRYDFDTNGDAEGWTTRNLGDPSSGPVSGVWSLVASASDPVLLSPVLGVAASGYSTLSVTMANDGNPADGSRMQIFWSTRADTAFSEARSTWVDVSNDGVSATYTIDLASLPAWTGTIERIRIDPITYGDGHGLSIDSVVLSP